MKRTKVNDDQQFGLPSIGIPAEVFLNPKLTDGQKLLFGLIRNLSHSARGCWASNKYLAKYIGVKQKTTISNHLKELSNHHYIIIEHFDDDGRTTRSITINPNYPAIYSDALRQTYHDLNRSDSLLKNLYPPSASAYPPFGISLTKEESKKERLNNIVGPQSNSDTSKNKKRSAQERNIDFNPLAEFLYDIIKSTKNIQYSKTQINSWADEIRKLSEVNKITPVRIKQALRWYKNNIGGEYIPIIESGYSLRMKFIKLESAKQRSENGSATLGDKEMSGKDVSSYYKPRA